MTTTQNDWQPLMLLADAPNGSPTIYCVHGGGGDAEELKPLAKALEGETRFYGLDSRGFDGVRAPFETYEEEAACHVEHINARDAGPYILAGFSGGGGIAYEMAQQILRAGRKVELIIMLDAQEPSTWAIRMSRFDRLKLIPRANFYFLLKIASEKLQNIVEQMLGKGASPSLGEASPPTVKARLYEAFLRSQERYVPSPYTGEIFLIRARSRDWYHVRAGNSLGWDRLVAGRIEVCKIDCEHQDLVRSPVVSQVARVVRERLNRLGINKSSENY
jgi:thioesterase domain-containing protein